MALAATRNGRSTRTLSPPRICAFARKLRSTQPFGKSPFGYMNVHAQPPANAIHRGGVAFGLEEWAAFVP
jgi:hypothetical protein